MSALAMFEGHTLVWYFSFESVSGSVNKNLIKWLSTTLWGVCKLILNFIFWLLFIFTPSLIDSSRTFFAGNATLVYHLLSRWILWCYSATCYFISTLVEIYFWWSSTSGGAFLLVEFFFTQLRLCPVVEISFLLLLLLCSPVRCGGALFVASSGSHSYTAQ